MPHSKEEPNVNNLVEAHATYVLNERQSRSRATHVAIIQNMMQDIRVRTLYSAVDKDLQVKTSGIIFSINATYVCCSGTTLLFKSQRVLAKENRLGKSPQT